MIVVTMWGSFIDFAHQCVLHKLFTVTLLSLVLVYTHFSQRQDTIGMISGQNEMIKEIDKTCNLNFFQTASEQYQRYNNNSFYITTLPSLGRTKKVNMWHQEQSRKFEVKVTIIDYKSMFHLQVIIVDFRNTSQGGASF